MFIIHLFIYSFIHLFGYSCIHLFIYSLVTMWPAVRHLHNAQEMDMHRKCTKGNAQELQQVTEVHATSNRACTLVALQLIASFCILVLQVLHLSLARFGILVLQAYADLKKDLANANRFQQPFA